MGQAFHKKKMALGRGTKTTGVGISYVEPTQPQARELTAEEVAVREQEKAAVEAKRGTREHNVYALVHRAGFVLDEWEDETLKERGLSLDDSGLNAALDKIVDRALTMVNTAITRCCDNDGIDVERLIETLDDRSAMAKSYNAELSSALEFVSKKFTSIFETLNA